MRFVRYSQAFRRQVVQDIENGRFTIHGASQRYGIAYGAVQYWLRREGKKHLLGKVVRVETVDERDRIKQLEQEKQALESALAQTQLKLLAMEKLIEVAEEHYKIDIKKNSGQPPSKS